MLEVLTAWVINNYLGKYVENLNTDQLSIALLQGAVEFENLPLKKDALRQLGLPIHVCAGHIGKVRLKIPISQITSAPWEILMEQLYLVAGPIKVSEIDEEVEEQASQDYKLSLLDAIEARWRSEREVAQDSNYYASSYSSWLGFGMSFATNIIENLQLKIKDVHLRYEDDVSIDGQIFAAGIRVESLSAQSCDEAWTPQFMSCYTSSESFKLLEMSGFSVYWDKIDKTDMWGNLNLVELAVAMNVTKNAKRHHEYLLSPVNAQAHVKRNRSEQPLRSRTHPRIVCDLMLDQVPLALTEWQYNQMVGCKKGLERLGRQGVKERPTVSVKEDARAWWRYAMRRMVKPSISWEAALERARDNVAYVNIYTKLLTNSAAPLPPDSKLFKETMEWNRQFDELRALRQVAMSRVKPPELKKEGQREGLVILANWFPQWWGWHSPPQETSTSANPTIEEQILDALADTVENNTLLRRDTVFGQFNFTLKQGTFNICNDKREPVMELQFENVKLGLESRPRNGSHKFTATLGALYLRDHITEDSAFPVLISPQRCDSAPSGRPGRNLPPGLVRILNQSNSGGKEQPLFQLTYEYKPFNATTDYRLQVHLKSLDVVYNPGATKWIIDFFTSPYQNIDIGLRQAARQSYHAMKKKTKQQLLSNWEGLLRGQINNRKIWDIELDISAPQIFLVEHFNDKNAVLCVLDFGKLHFSNRQNEIALPILNSTEIGEEDEDDEEAFQTPCSTPPGSQAGNSPPNEIDDSTLNEQLFHNKLYDMYTVDLCDLQILVGRVKDNWKFAHLKGTSTLHVLDRFNISLQIERRVVYTMDPQYPSLTVVGNLPKLVVHVNEMKVQALRTLLDVVSGKGLISPLRSVDSSPIMESKKDYLDDVDGEFSEIDDHLDTGAKLLMLQFSVDQLALEVQSRSRSVAELQVSGVKMTFMKRPYDTSLSLSVHGLLLVDALQTFGPDFELLVASHKHVGMNSVSGSLQDSEPTSPVSPASPEPDYRRATSPMAISQALRVLSSSSHKDKYMSIPSPPHRRLPPPIDMPDSEALITVELLFVDANCPTNEDNKEHLQIANIQFNNLDIIANQETIVELMGFMHRVFPQNKSHSHSLPLVLPQENFNALNEDDFKSEASSYPSQIPMTRTQLTFDFHRLNVLLLRAVMKDSVTYGRKIATATMTEAKIHANVGTNLELEGSLGGLQVLDLTPEGHTHQRILSMGEDPLTQQEQNERITLNILASMTAEMYSMSGYQAPASHPIENQAFSFSIKRSAVTSDTDVAEICVRLASVWYTHSPELLFELQSCADEFKQYLSNLARSIGSAATEMAIGLVRTRTESLAHSLSMYGSASDISQTPRKRLSYSLENVDANTRGTTTPHSPPDRAPCTTLLKWDIVLASPVVVLPRNRTSTQVAVAHLGSITVTNSQESSPVTSPWILNPYTSQRYDIQIRDINLYTVDIKKRFNVSVNLAEGTLMSAEELYSCRSDGKPVLHDTTIQLSVVRELSRVCMKQQDDILLESGADFIQVDQQETLQISGKVVTPLKLSLSRQQYEQVLETVESCVKQDRPKEESRGLGDIQEEPELHTGVSTLNLDPTLRARMLLLNNNSHISSAQPSLAISVAFELPILTLELIADLGVGEQGLVDLSFKDLIIQFDRLHNSETNVQVSLRSLLMEDLQKPVDSKHRYIMVSSEQAGDDSHGAYPVFVSKSCPNLASLQGKPHPWHSSLPDHLEAEHVFGATTTRHRHIAAVENSMEHRIKGVKQACPYTPPPSPRAKLSPTVYSEENLVHINVVIKPPSQPGLKTVRHTTVDFNSLDMIVNVESWVVVLDFFGISDIDQESAEKRSEHQEAHIHLQEQNKKEEGEMNSVLEVTVRSLSVMLIRSEYEVARAVMSQLNACLVSTGKNGSTQTEAKVGSFSLSDLTPIHSHLYRERFITSGLKISMNKYSTPDYNMSRKYDVQLSLDMTSLVYVHTQRFVAEIQTFFGLFPHLRQRIGSTKGNDTSMLADENTVSTRLLIELYAASPIILLPMSTQSTSVLVVDLGKLTVKNQLLFTGDPGTMRKSADPDREVLLDVMSISLESMDLMTGERHSGTKSSKAIPVGSYSVERVGWSLLRKKCLLQLHVERNLMPLLHCVPDLSINGTLSTLAATLSLSDYKIISGLLSYNIGECLDDLQIPIKQNCEDRNEDEGDNVWICTSMNLELVDVSVRLIPNEGPALACVNFIKSRLVIETYSNKSQDVDLISQEILITDTRFEDEPANKRSNVFINILTPIKQANDSETVQAQVHHRKRNDLSKFTILLNNMRLMAVLDWWESVRDFIMTRPDNVQAVNVNCQVPVTPPKNEDVPFELKLNITDSEIVVVEDTSQWDSNAVILKSTTVFTYRPLEIDKPMSCNLNHCEMFSCLLGMEEETALSIIDPVTINIEIICTQNSDGHLNKILKVQMVHLSLRLSYHDMRMFSQMLQSLPRQTQSARSQSLDQHPANFLSQMEKLKSLGFGDEDCSEALKACGGKLDDAALWLTQNASPVSTVASLDGSPKHLIVQSPLSFNQLEVQTSGISLCVIDDCGDADVPLMEFSLSQLNLQHDYVKYSGVANLHLTAHYYNRLLSGWEPFIEPWSCNICWGRRVHNITRLEWNLASVELLNINITSALIELYRTVKESWTQDYYHPKEMRHEGGGKSPPGYRRRSPFVPFALKNDTGSVVSYLTLITTGDSLTERQFYSKPEEELNWTIVEPGAIVPFTFNEHGKLRHKETHKLRTHQIGIKVEGWYPIDPVTVDRVGVYFRQASPDLSNSELNLSPARVVLEVTLEGSARKLVTVRSALQIVNKLPHTVEVKLDNTHLQKNFAIHLTVQPEKVLSVPLVYSMSKIWVRPMAVGEASSLYHNFSASPIDWKSTTQPGQMSYEPRYCLNNRGQTYRLCAAIKRENYPIEKSMIYINEWVQPAHTITLLSPLTLVNLLPYDLHYKLKDISSGLINPGCQTTIHETDLDKEIGLAFHLENFPVAGNLIIPPKSSNTTMRVRLGDQSKRRLHLQASITGQPATALKVSVFAPFWILNKTALPLVFRQDGVATETAGQYEEHEVARMVAPLLFSFAEYDSSPTIVARIGSGVHPEGLPQWCRNFTLQPGVQVRRLKVSLRDYRPDLVYIVGIEVRSGRGRYRATKIVTLSAYYQIHNKSSYNLQFSQKCFATTVNDPGAQATYLTAVPNCYLPFHWPRLDKDQLLCFRLLNVSQCSWSGGFKIDDNNSFHLNIRDLNGLMYFLRIEIVLQGATFFIIITDADTMPPPIRVDNFSQVTLQFHQADLTGLECVVRPQTSIPYAWDEPTKPHTLRLTAPGGVSAVYDLNKLGEGPGLTYENFIYIAFTGTFKNSLNVDPLDVQCQQLVLDVPDPNNKRVVLSPKQQGARSQLWRMTADGQLQHEGSSPPRASAEKILVLDICGPAPQPQQYVGLTIRRPDKRRTSTQSWRFTEDGRLCCVHNNMCVQAKDGFYGLRKGSEVVLGPPQQHTFQTTESGLPLEQAVNRQRFRPGSGFLNVTVTTDGPTRVIQIRDIKGKRFYAKLDEGAWTHVLHCKQPTLTNEEAGTSQQANNKEIQVTVSLECVGISLVSQRPPEELILARLSGINITAAFNSKSEMLNISVNDIQVDNQLFESQCPAALYVTPNNWSSEPNEAARPAIEICTERNLTKHSYNADIYKRLQIELKSMTLIIDERLLLKLFAFAGWGNQEETDNVDESDFEAQKVLAEAASVHAKRYYFGSLTLTFTQARLSVITTNKLSDRLIELKRKLGLTLLKFEDAGVELQPFDRVHVFENSQFLFNSIIKHYKHELKRHGAIILASVDFLGNPLGLLNDFNEGVSEFINEGNVGALVKNVAHGLSNSAAKFTESLGDGLGRVVLDDAHEEMRQRIKSQTASTSDHIVAGLKGLGFGLLGGVSSVFKQTYDGATNDGFQGFLSGLGKGVVGTVTKPVVGVLDLATETASAVRDSSRSSNRQGPARFRLARCVTSPTGLLPEYNAKQSLGQQFLYIINQRNYAELFMAYGVLLSGLEDLRIVISSESIRVFSCNSSSTPALVFEKRLRNLQHCAPLETINDRGESMYYIVLTMKNDSDGSAEFLRHHDTDLLVGPKVKCESSDIASWVSHQVNYAKARYVERQHTLVLAGESLLEESI